MLGGVHNTVDALAENFQGWKANTVTGPGEHL